MTESILSSPAAQELKGLIAEMQAPPLACVVVFGCQQNEADGERLRGLLAFLGYELSERPEEADLVLLHTCAIRDHAEQRVLGILGAMKHRLKPGCLLGVCGCMTQQEAVQERLKRSFPRVDFAFGTGAFDLLPGLILERMRGGKRAFVRRDPTAPYRELPYVRSGRERAWVTIMQGCDNFCTYCIVPYVRGRERSRPSSEIVGECRALVSEGFSELFLLGQNVNSYRPDGARADFPALLERVNAIPGDFSVRFMTSHPKDAGGTLFDAMARSEKVARTLHLPMQSGSDAVLKAMNRGYTRDAYHEKVELARAAMPDLNLTSDIIVGFPGETERDFEDTLDMLRRVRFNQLFTFIYSPRSGTPAASIPDATPKEEIKRRFGRLLEVQREIEAELSLSLSPSLYGAAADRSAPAGRVEDTR